LTFQDPALIGKDNDPALYFIARQRFIVKKAPPPLPPRGLRRISANVIWEKFERGHKKTGKKKEERDYMKLKKRLYETKNEVKRAKYGVDWYQRG
jgi:hypothetical protein